MRLEGKRALVTGGGSGIGAATARLFAREGARVALQGRTAAKLDAVADEIRAAGGLALTVAGDSADPALAAAAVDEVVAAWGGLDVLFCNAGTFARAPLLETTPAEWEAVFRNNVTASYIMTRAALPALVEGGGGVVLFNGSTIGLRPIAGAAAYCAAKAAVAMLARTVALEYGAKGVRSLCIAPGVIDTPIHDPFLDPEKRAEQLAGFAATQPLSRVGRPEDVAQMALFLASDDASWVTGEVVNVDGGVSLV